MFGPVPDPVGVLVVVWAVILAHEIGHYVTGRRIVGIPKTDIKLVSPFFPRYVALRDNDGWVIPRGASFERYRDAYARHDPEGEHLERFVAGGEIIQAAIIVPVALVISALGLEPLAVLVITISLLTTVIYVVVDAVTTQFVGAPAGDYSALWAVDWKIPPTLLFGFVAVHLGAFVFIG